MPTEKEVRAVLRMLNASPATEINRLIYYNSDEGGHMIVDLNSNSSTDDFISELKRNGNIRESSLNT